MGSWERVIKDDQEGVGVCSGGTSWRTVVAGVSMPSLWLPRLLLPSQVAGILRHCESLLGHQAEVSGIRISEVVSSKTEPSV